MVDNFLLFDEVCKEKNDRKMSNLIWLTICGAFDWNTITIETMWLIRIIRGCHDLGSLIE